MGGSISRFCLVLAGAFAVLATGCARGKVGGGETTSSSTSTSSGGWSSSSASGTASSSSGASSGGAGSTSSTGGGSTGSTGSGSASSSSGGPSLSTLAGQRATPGFVDGPGGESGTARFNHPFGVAVDGQGNVFVADYGNSCIRKIDAAGNVTTLAGNGSPGFADNSGEPSGATQFRYPAGVAVDGQGTVFVADTDNNRIRRIDPGGRVTTLAGTGRSGFADGPGGPTGTAELYMPFGLALDGRGGLLVADSVNNRIRRIDPAGNVTTVAGNGHTGFADGPASEAEFNFPTGVAADGQGNVYVADSVNNRIRKIDPAGNVSTLAGDGREGFADGTGGRTGTAEFDEPQGVAVDAQGNVLVADTINCTIRRIDPGGDVTTLAGDGPVAPNDPTARPALDGPSGLAVDSQGNVVVADFGDSRLRLIAP